jgi:hypothetical protein
MNIATDIQFIPCHTFGGGWIVPRTDSGFQACLAVMGEYPAPCEPIGDEDGYVIDPRDVGDIVGALREAGADVTL